MRIGLIGCGRVGVTIFHILKKRHKVIGVYDTNKKSEQTAIRLLGIHENPPYRELIEQCEVIFLATPDDSLAKAYNKMYNQLSGTKYVFHFSGILPADILLPKKNVHRASVHPFATFPEITVRARSRPFVLSIEGDRAAVSKARNIFSPKYFTLKHLRKQDKTLYHLIGVFSSNLLVGLLAAIYELAQKLKWKEDEIHQLVYPIIEETLGNIKKHGIRSSLSGPLSRGDIETVQTHLKALKKDKRLLKIYKEVSLYIAQNLTSGNKKRNLKKLLDQ
jgi:predicted short-subunit dehydrogenase-like oxidoreductase (DUF2520 family)